MSNYDNQNVNSHVAENTDSYDQNIKVLAQDSACTNEENSQQNITESDESVAAHEDSSSSSAISSNEYREKIIEALKQVIDPEIHINIVDLGLVYRVEVSEDLLHIEIEFTLTTPGCPLADEIEQSINDACHAVLPHAEITSTLVWTPMWNADFMSEDARLELGFPI